MHHTYILKSKTAKRTYIGCTADIEKRLREHNKGIVKSSKAYRPYSLLYKETFLTLQEARRKETFYKSANGRRALKKLLGRIV
ncbi:MAG: GIY-YIG nuclease family protein [Candidatus Omnitrophica bacterium]|nr:GIY-YIG nuclease family protein [Candidatus Omnitrophota bacterium]MBU1926117.1 GIY-YIG nuclease family protein [Candidatus Omnitrophota bacterium]